jgi:hypothetical protein
MSQQKKTKKTNGDDDTHTHTALLLPDQMQGILDLMNQRARGAASNDQLDSAVSDILVQMGVPGAAVMKEEKKKVSSSSSSSSLKMDMGNYDDDDSDVEENDTRITPKPAGPPSKKNKTPLLLRYSKEEYRELLDSTVPMGHMGAQMMTTFGDGPQPNMEALQAALQGTRTALQLTIMDARALRRKVMAQYSQAKQEASSKRFKKNAPAASSSSTISAADASSQSATKRPRPMNATSASATMVGSTAAGATTTTTAAAADSAMVFRAWLTDQSHTHDPLVKHHPCGFDMEQLSWLYPEEVRAYDRWNELHSAYEESKNKDQEVNTAAQTKSKNKKKKKGTGKNGENEEDDLDDPEAEDETENQEDENNGEDDEYLGGHLRERAAVFDVRTVQMPQDNYMKFAKVRQGSFLPRGVGKTRTKLELEWEQQLDETTTTRGRVKEGSWMHMPAIAVRFLHWLGFEPPEVPPPDIETTQVLAFLGYDRMGRIVEKAIYLRNLKKKTKEQRMAENNNKKKKAGSSTNSTIDNPSSFDLRELPAGEHLTAEDIKVALEDPDVKPAPLFRLEGEKKEGELPRNVQLYFGPGFEQRLELELEEYVRETNISEYWSGAGLCVDALDTMLVLSFSHLLPIPLFQTLPLSHSSSTIGCWRPRNKPKRRHNILRTRKKPPFENANAHCSRKCPSLPRKPMDLPFS